MEDSLSPEKILRGRGLRVTPQREGVLRFFIDHEGGHFSADAVRDALLALMPGLARGTTYKVLRELVRAHACEELATPDGTMLYGLRLHAHHHFYCTSCHRWFDVQAEGLAGLKMRGAEPGTTQEDVEVTFRGTCSDCAG